MDSTYTEMKPPPYSATPFLVAESQLDASAGLISALTGSAGGGSFVQT
jgi:hypothetical protein